MKTLLAFGDSNTWGALPVDHPTRRFRYGPNTRWTGIARAVLGPDWSLIEEGLPGRTTRFEDPVMGRHMDGSLGLPIALQSHGPIDVMTLMLGTNDFKTRFNVSAEEIAASVGGLVDFCLSGEMQDRHQGFKVLLICPPPIFEIGLLSDQFVGGAEKSQSLAKHISAIAADRGVGFLDAGAHIQSSQIDGIHFAEDAHQTLGRIIANSVQELA